MFNFEFILFCHCECSVAIARKHDELAKFAIASFLAMTSFLFFNWIKKPFAFYLSAFNLLL